MVPLKVKLLGIRDKQVWNRFVSQSEFGSPRQLWEWGEWKKTQGLKPLRIGVIRDGYLILAMAVILKPEKILGNLVIVDQGPVFHQLQDLKESLPLLNEFLGHLSKTYNMGLVEIKPFFGKKSVDEEFSKPDQLEQNAEQESLSDEPDFNISENLTDNRILETFLKNNYSFSLQNEPLNQKFLIDLSKKQTEIWESFSFKIIEEISLAKAGEVEVKSTPSSSREFRNRSLLILEFLNKRQPEIIGQDNFKSDFFLDLCEKFAGTGYLSLKEVYYKGDLSMVVVLSTIENLASPIFLASLQESKFLVPGVIWQLIVFSKKQGCKYFDLWPLEDKKLLSFNLKDEIRSLNQNPVILNFWSCQSLSLVLNPIKFGLWDTTWWLKEEGGNFLKKQTKKTLKVTKEATLDLWGKLKNQAFSLKTQLDNKIKDLKKSETRPEPDQNSVKNQLLKPSVDTEPENKPVNSVENQSSQLPTSETLHEDQNNGETIIE